MDDANLTMEPGRAGAVPGYPYAVRTLVLAAVAFWTGTAWLPAQEPGQEPPGMKSTLVFEDTVCFSF